jgi:ABC-type phosphate transport system auxiliary subunit
MSEDEEKFDVTIKGQISGFDIATTKRVLNLEKELQKQGKELETILKQVNEQKKLLDVINTRIERLESFLSSFSRTK